MPPVLDALSLEVGGGQSPLPGMSPREFAKAYGDADLQKRIQEVSQTLYREQSENIAMRRLAKPLLRARGNALEAREGQAAGALPPLNP